MLALGANGRGRAGLLSALRPQDAFATSLYTGTGAAQTITNGLDLAGKGGLVWGKARSVGNSNILVDTQRGPQNTLFSNLTNAEGAFTTVTAFSPTGFSLGSDGAINGQNNTNVAWSFRRASKFFDIVTYTGDGTSGRVIPHALGIKPGMIIVKRRSTANGWYVYHRSLTATQFLILNDTAAAGSAGPIWDNVEPTDTAFTVGVSGNVNLSGSTYVAYLFAHDPDTTNGIVQCGSVTLDGSGAATVPLGYPAQWVLLKRTDSAGSWLIIDTARGWAAGADKYLFANGSDAETSADLGSSISTGFTIAGLNANAPFVYCAIRAPT